MIFCAQMVDFRRPGHIYRGCPLSEVKSYCHDPVGTTVLVFYREVKCTVLYSEGPLREVPLYDKTIYYDI